MFDKEQFFKNVFSIIEEKGISIYSLENSIGVSAGYLAKLRKDDTRKNITADLMIKISDSLGVSLDYLCKVECGALTKDEVNILSFFEMVKKDTLSNKYKWKDNDAEYIEAGQGLIYCALIRYGNFGQPYIYSTFKNKRVSLIGNSYYVEIKDEVFLIIVQLEGANSKLREYECYLLMTANKKFETSNVCATSSDKSGMLDSALKELYKVAEASSKKIALDDKTSKFICSFITEHDYPKKNGVKL